jgi:hypothetical protein
MRVHLQWDDAEQTIVRWEFEGWVGMVNYIIPINDTATMGILHGGRADSILNMGFKLPFPDRHPRELIKPIRASRDYGLGYVVVVTRNPLAIAILRAMFAHDDNAGRALYIVASVVAARTLIARLRAAPDALHMQL